MRFVNMCKVSLLFVTSAIKLVIKCISLYIDCHSDRFNTCISYLLYNVLKHLQYKFIIN